MNRAVAALALFASAIAGSATAQNSTNGPPPAAAKEGGIVGDPRGAIRALGGTSQTDFAPGSNKVDVPKLGGSEGVGRTGGTPRGTTGPR